MIEIFRKIHDLLDARERRNAVWLFCMMLIMGLLDAVGVASVMPFIAVVADPELLEANEFLNAVYNDFGFSNSDTFLLFLGGLVLVLVVGGLVFKALTYWAMARFNHMRSYTISARLMRGYLNRPYSFFLNRHSADLGKAVLSEAQQVTSNALIPAVNLVAHGTVTICLITLVVVVNPLVALVSVLVLGGVYGLIYVILRHFITRIGEERLQDNEKRFQIAQEALAGVKDVKVLGLENGYMSRFAIPASRFARAQASIQIINSVPRFALEALVFGGMIILLLILLSAEDGEFAKVLPLITLYAFAGTRLIPALQSLFASFANLRYGKPALNALHRDLVEAGQAGYSAIAGMHAKTNDEVMPLKQSIELDGVTYTYPQAKEASLSGMNITIPACTTVGLVGSTGAGKTTIVDIILGLLEPQHGCLKIDGIVIKSENFRSWQNNIGYVPQSIFLADDTVAANIAFGEEVDELDQAAVEHAARIAELHEFVINELPKGYETMVGERGVRLSGGQRQRIGIARALYHDPEVLLLDEATSALDNITEKAVMDAVHNLNHRKTIIIIAHRLSTVRNCDQIFLLEKGKLSVCGTFDELITKSSHFEAMTRSL